MATPVGAEHRDLEQRLNDLRTIVDRLSNAVLSQRQLSVTEGDFIVSGGGGIVVKDGGGIVSEYPGGQVGVEYGPVTPAAFYDHGITIRTEDGQLRTYMVQTVDGNFDAGIGTPAAPCRNFGAKATNVASIGDETVTSLGRLAGKTVEVMGGVNGITVDATGGTAIFGQAATATYIGFASTGSAANAVIGADGRVYRSTSSLRYKRDVESAEVDPAKVLQLEPHTFRSIAEVDEVGDDAPRYVGFIAEELDDLGLGMFVDYDHQGRPDAIQYDRLAVGLLAVVKDQQSQLDAIAARLDALENAA